MLDILVDGFFVLASQIGTGDRCLELCALSDDDWFRWIKGFVEMYGSRVNAAIFQSRKAKLLMGRTGNAMRMAAGPGAPMGTHPGRGSGPP